MSIIAWTREGVLNLKWDPIFLGCVENVGLELRNGKLIGERTKTPPGRIPSCDLNSHLERGILMQHAPV